MLFPFVVFAAAVTAIICGFSDMLWPTYLWAIPLSFIGAFAGGILLYVIFLLIVSLFTDTKKEPESHCPFYRALIIFTVGLILHLFRIKPEVKGAELVPANSRWLLVGNHLSMFDPMVALYALRKHELSFVAKPGVFRIPIAKQLLHRDLYLTIDRENNREALKTILKAADYIKRDLTSFGIYPEGTRSRDGNMLPFRSGAFKIAQRAKVPVVVVTVENTDIVTSRFPWRSTAVNFTVHAVFDADTVEEHSTNELSDMAREIMQRHLGK